MDASTNNNKNIKIIEVPLSKLKDLPGNPRYWSDQAISDLTESIKRFNIVDFKQESFSAKESGKRPVFNEILNDLKNGKYEGILTWAADRLSRNAGDLGSLVDLMDSNKLQQIRTYGQSFSNTPNEKFLLMILCSQAKLENDNRGVNVKRGIRAKCETG